MARRGSAPAVKIQATPCPLCERDLTIDGDGDLVCYPCSAFWNPETGVFGEWLDTGPQCRSQVYRRVRGGGAPDPGPGDEVVQCVREDGHPVDGRDQCHVGAGKFGHALRWPNSWLVDAPDAVDEEASTS